MHIGKIQPLKISRKTDAGYYLSDEEGNEVFIASLFSETDWDVDKIVEVFVYQDDQELKACNEKPFAEVGQYAVMECVSVLPSGAFMDWGIIKDLFVPYKEQKGKMEEGKRYLIYVYVDEKTGLITGTAKFNRTNNPEETIALQKDEKVDLIIMNPTDLGWNVLINQRYFGLVYASEVFKKLIPLSEEIGYIQLVREDGKIDVSLQPSGFQNIDEFKQSILAKLEENYGLLYLSDASSPEEIKAVLQMSKKNFKKAIGGLYKDKIIDLKEDRIILL